MRNRIMIFCAFCAIAVSSSAQEKFSVRGIANEELNNQLLYLCLTEDGEKPKEVILDSTIVKKGKFSFTGERQRPDIAFIKDMDGETCPLILEKGKILVNIKTNERGGTPLNDTLNVALNRMHPVMDNMVNTVMAIQKLLLGVKSDVFSDMMLNDTAFRAKYDRIDKVFLAQRDSVLCCIDDYKNCIVGAYIFTVGGVVMSFDDMITLQQKASSVFSQNILVKDIIEKKRQAQLRMEAERNMSKEQLEAQRKRQEMDTKIKIGERFPDAKVKEDTGGIKFLSDYVGKGKYVLIDFWASWCGPCLHEIPNVKSAYEKYASKGFEVISISIDHKLKPWRDAIEKQGMNWTQLLNVDASDIYGIHTIPETYLVDPAGIVISKDLRGEKLKEILSELFE